MNVNFVTSVAEIRQLPQPTLPEIAFAGRSNVGKSSLMNTVLARKNLVKTGKTPGKTRLLNFFNVDDIAMFVDLPGYGYAAVSKGERAKWGRLIEGYFNSRRNLMMCFILVDIRRSFEEEERMMYEMLINYGIKPCIVLTKADKLSKNQLLNNKTRIAKEIGVDAKDLIHFSTVTGEGRDAVRAAVSMVVPVNW